MSGFQTKAQMAQAKHLRRAMTPAERILWYHLRAHRFMGLSVRRQAPVGPFIVDFLIPEHRLIVEADCIAYGSQRDIERDRWLASRGFHILRLSNRDVLTNLSGCLDTIAAQVPQH